MIAPLWTPSPERIEQANLHAFMREVCAQWNVAVTDYSAIYRWSIEQPEQFWQSLWSFAQVKAEYRGELVLKDADKMPGAQWFPDARLNFADNLLRRRDKGAAVVFWGEDRVKRTLTHATLYDQVSQLAQALRAKGVVAGDRVGGRNNFV